MAMLAHILVHSGVARNVLVVAGENRLTAQSRDAAVQTLAQVDVPSTRSRWARPSLPTTRW